MQFQCYFFLSYFIFIFYQAALHLAVENENIEMINVLLSYPKTNVNLLYSIIYIKFEWYFELKILNDILIN